MLLVRPGGVGSSESPESARSEGAVDERPASPDLVRASAHFRARDWSAAAAAAERAVATAPADPRAWRLLGTSRYLAGDPDAALGAWARVGDTRVDGVFVRGLARTRHPVVHALLGIAPGEPLDRDQLGLARRRAALLPTATLARVDYRALPDGWVEVEATVLESPPHPFSSTGLAAAGAAAVTGEGRVRLAGLLGTGERLDLRWRPAAGRHSFGVALATAGALGLGGLVEVGVARVALDDAEPVSAWLRATDWTTPWLRWELGVRGDRASALRPAATGVLELARADDRAMIRVAVAAWPALADETASALLALDAAFLHGGPSDVWSLGARAGVRAARGAVPSHLMPAAEATPGPALDGPFMGIDAAPLLRAQSPVQGTRVAHGGVEATRWVGGALRLGIAAFVDAAAVRDATTDRPLVALGAGLRLAVPGLDAPLRVDHAWNPRDGSTRWSAGLAFNPVHAFRP